MNLKGGQNLKMANDRYVFPQIIEIFYLGEITRYTIVAWIVAIETNIAPWVDWQLQDGTYTIVTSHYKYIVLSCNDIIILVITKSKKVWNVCKSNARWWKILQMVGIPICHFVQRYSYGES